jgi:hypothetical protein
MRLTFQPMQRLFINTPTFPGPPPIETAQTPAGFRRCVSVEHVALQGGISMAGRIWTTIGIGALAGAAGVLAMTLGEKAEQAITRRPNSYTPAHTLERLLRMPERPDSERLGLNWTMHYGQGIVLGVLRAAMARLGLRGPVGSFMFMNARLLNDQTLENATGVGAPPWTWPRDEQVIDLLHKGVYAFVTGAVADWLVPGPAPEVRSRRRPDGMPTSLPR